MATLLVGALIQDNDRIAKLEAERFASVIIELQDEAVLAGTPYAVTLESNGYTTIAPFDPGSASESELLRRRSLQEGVRLKSDVAQPNQQDNSGDAFS